MNLSTVELKLELIDDEIISRLDEFSEYNNLMSGRAGVCLYLYERYLSTKKIEYLDFCLNNLEISFNRILHIETINPTYSSGLSGILDVANYISKTENINIGLKKINSKIEDSLYNIALSYLKRNNYDFLHGALGIANYLLNIKSPKLKYLVKYLLSIGVHINKSMVAWKSYNKNGKVEYNLGLSHGIPSIIVFLSKCVISGIEENSCKDYLLKTINFVESNKIENAKSIYSYTTNNTDASRLAWCYGDLGIARSFYISSVALSSKEILDNSLLIMGEVSNRINLEENYVQDASLCHGSSGIAHIFNLFYNETRSENFKKLTYYWINETIILGNHKNGIAGYKTWYGNEQGWRNEVGFLEGVVGIGLSLNYFLSYNKKSKWSQFLLLSL